MTTRTGHHAEFTSPDQHRFRAFVAHPPGRPKGALVLLHEMDARSPHRVHSHAQANPMPGLSQRIRALAHEHAAAGHDHGYKYQMAFSGEELVKPLQPVDSSRAMLDVQIVVAWAQGQEAEGKVGILGFCWGGLLAWQAACTLPQVFAAASFYGGGMTDPEVRGLRPMCPVLVHLPSKGEWMTHQSMDAVVAVQSDHFPAQGSVRPGQKVPMVQIERYDAAYGFDHAASRQHDPLASQAARWKTGDFFDRYLTI